MGGIKIKVCGMREPKNISELVKLKPDYIGFIFYPKSKRFVEEKLAEQILKKIPKSIKKVGVFVNELHAEILKTAYLFKLDLIQLHGDESPEYCKEFIDVGLPVIKSFGIDEHFTCDVLDSYEDSCEYFLFDTKSAAYGGTGQKFDWSSLENYTGNKPIFLSGGIGENDMPAIKNLKNINIYAIDVNSKFEVEPALKNIAQLTNFITELKKIK